MLVNTLRAVKANLRLGWNMEGNWAPPLVYIFIALATPAASVMMLVVMYKVIMGDSGETSFISFLIGGSVVFIFVRLVMQGAGWAVIEDREHYRILRYIYIAPVPFPAQMFGRVGVKIFIAFVGSLLTILAGWLFLHIPFRADGIAWGHLIGGLLVGLVGIMAIGWMLASAMLLVDRMGWVWAEGFAGVLFLVSGMVIPLSVLPAPFALVGKLIPITYWAEITRHALYGTHAALSLPGMSMGGLWLNLVITVAGCVVLSAVFFKIADYFGRKYGRIEAETFY